MKKQIYATLFLSAMAGLMFTSCSSDDDGGGATTTPEVTSFNLQKLVEVRCSSNDIEMGANAGGWYYKEQHEYGPFAQYAPADITEDEKAFVLDYLQNHPNEGTTEFNHYNYFIQYLGSGHETYTTVDMNNATQTMDGSNHIDWIRLVDQNGEEKHINDYNANYGPRALVLNTKITNAVYHESWGSNEFNYYQFYTIEYNGKKNMYLCFDYATEKSDGSKVEPNGKYDDYVIKITPACDETPDVDPVDPADPVDPETPAVVVKDGEVEVNLAVQDHKDENSSKLSVHVRDTVNFKVFIPVADKYYCSVDDMYIVEQHYENMTYNNHNTIVEREINGQKITLTITYTAEGIYIESQGINAKALEYCRNVYDDGITFEVSNYYNSSITRDELIILLNQSTITFTDNEPKSYVNAKPKNDNGDYINVDADGLLLDCTVAKK